MTPEEFRKHAHALVDWIADYSQKVEDFPVLSRSRPGEIYDSLPDAAPEQSEPFETIFDEFERIILPGITHWQSPNFFGYFPANNSGPSILGELLSAGLGVQGMMWSTSPACTELETRVLDWLVPLLGLPEKFHSQSRGGGVIQDSASSATLCAILTAREVATDYSTNTSGAHAPLVAYASEQTHSSVEKGMRIAGIGDSNFRKLPVDDTYALSAGALKQAIQTDLEAGKKPFFVCATLGTTSSNAFDPLVEIGRLCREHDIWLHVDAAMSGTAFLCPEFRHLQRGVELADSYCFNPHKWMFVNFDCDCFYVADRGKLIRTLSILPEYLRNQASEAGQVFDYRDWQVPLGRRFRALKLWFVLRSFGQEQLRAKIRANVQWAKTLSETIQADPDFELMAPVPLNLVCFRHHAGDEFNERLLKALNDSGKMLLTHTRLRGHYVLRMCIGQTNTTWEHVQASWRLIVETAATLEK